MGEVKDEGSRKKPPVAPSTNLDDAEPMFTTHGVGSVSEGRQQCNHTSAKQVTERWFVLPALDEMLCAYHAKPHIAAIRRSKRVSSLRRWLLSLLGSSMAVVDR